MKFLTIISIPKTLYFNLKMFPFKQAIKLPVFVAYNTKFGNLHKGAITFEEEIRKGMVMIGFTGLSSYVNKTRNYIYIGNNATIKFRNTANFAKCVSLTVLGNLTIGDNFFSNDNFRISSHKAVIFGDNVLVGWDVRILDSDNHTVFGRDGEKRTNEKTIKIGNHVWIGAMSQILKGAEVGDDCIVAYGSLVCKKFVESNAIIAGQPARIIDRGISWKG